MTEGVGEIADFIAATQSDMAAHPPCNVILDLRFYGGGDYTLLVAGSASRLNVGTDCDCGAGDAGSGGDDEAGGKPDIGTTRPSCSAAAHAMRGVQVRVHTARATRFRMPMVQRS